MEEKKAKPWERQEGETEKAYEAFCIYRDMLAEGKNRSLRDVAQRLHKSLTLISKWNTAHDWQNRVREYDNDVEKQNIAKKRKLIQETKDRQLKISYSLEKKALEALNLLQPEEMSAKDIKEMLKLAMEIQEKNLVDEPVTEEQSQSSLAESIISAYEKRMGGDDE